MAAIKIGRLVMGICQTNCYFVYREGSHSCIFVDPADQGKGIYETLLKNGFRVEAILLTHGHFDHIWGVKELKELSGAKVYALDREQELLQDAGKNVSARAGRPCTLEADVLLRDGEKFKVGDIAFQVIATPGHTQGSCCYYIEEAGFLLSGDTLFRESVGRTDLPTGSMSQIVRSVKEKLFVLPEDTKVYPGHGDSTSIKYEKDYNPFCG